MSSLAGVFPIVPTPFAEDGAPALADLDRVVDWIVRVGADGLVFPGVASEFDTLGPEERMALVARVADGIGGRRPFVVGVSSASTEDSVALAAQAREVGAAAVMAMSPARLRERPEEILAYYREVAAAGPPVILQNAPAPVGSGLPMPVVARLVEAVPGVRWVKEEAMPCGQRISELLALTPPGLDGIFGGAGGRYITDEIARGAVGTMPAAELTDLHVLLWRAHLAGDRALVRGLYNRMLPLLNFQAVFRMAMTKEVLRRRGVIQATHVRAAGPRLDAGDHRELGEMLDEVADLLATG